MSWKGCDFRDCKRLAYRKDKLTGLSYCQYHKNYSTDIDKRTIAQKAAARIKEKQSAPEEETKPDLETWYQNRRLQMTNRCCNCPAKTNKHNEKYWRWSVCHVLPKNTFPSVAAHEDNWIELCITCHTLFDSNLATASKMKCFPIAIEQFKKFEHLINERHKFLTLFREYAEKIANEKYV